MPECDQQLTWNDLVRKYFPDASDELCDYILWNKTCFPLGSPEEVEEQIRKLAQIVGADYIFIEGDVNNA